MGVISEGPNKKYLVSTMAVGGIVVKYAWRCKGSRQQRN